ncbi:amino acid--tRNA ligase-related protein [Algiphilus sp.]|uniref:amino acid--tRNA ligase-related protein n=1 Tax=Algiphilus sp. TaxID=1872431 RepID=UPI003B52B174
MSPRRPGDDAQPAPLHESLPLRQRLARRARLLSDIRAFFAARDVLEVDTPLRAQAVVPEVHIRPLACDGGWLLPSPERYLKPLLAAGSGDIYQLSHAFRAGESGRHHAEEFLLCEWYRLHASMQALAQEVLELMAACGGPAADDAQWLRYEQAFIAHCGVHPLASATELHAAAVQHGIAPKDAQPESLPAASWLDLLMSLCVQPALGADGPVVLTHFPASDSPLAAPDDEDPRWAQRFEVFWAGLELANGCREARTLDVIAGTASPSGAESLDVARWSAGLPDCAGVALGVDRLLMRLTGQPSLDLVQPRP